MWKGRQELLVVPRVRANSESGAGGKIIRLLRGASQDAVLPGTDGIVNVLCLVVRTGASLRV